MHPLVLRCARYIRKFSIKQSLENHPYSYYCGICSVFIVITNVYQSRRFVKMYPDWTTDAKRLKGEYRKFKQQELHDIRNYNNNVHQMRKDLSTRNA